MRVLVACEESQRVTICFRDRGIEAYSCDILKSSGGHTEWHILGDVTKVLDGDCDITLENGETKHIEGQWDMIIAFPPCTYMTKAGAIRMRIRNKETGEIETNQERYQLMLEARKFFFRIMNAKCKKIAIENPTPMHLCNLPKETQVIQPYMFGEPYLKRTLLWLKNLPTLKATKPIDKSNCVPYVSGGSFRRDGTRKEKVGCTFSAKERSKTFWGVANAMADQWGKVQNSSMYGYIKEDNMIRLAIRSKILIFDDAQKCLQYIKRQEKLYDLQPWEWSIQCDDKEDNDYIWENL